MHRAERHLFLASIAVVACADPTAGFPPLDEVAQAIEERCRKHGVEHVHVVPAVHEAVHPLDVYILGDDSSNERVVLVVPFDARRFVACELLPSGDVSTGNGISY